MKIECEITMVFRPNENNQGFAFTTKQNMGNLEKFYNEEKDIGTDTHTRLISIKEKCKDALEK